MNMWGPDKDWQCFRCYKTYKPASMELSRTNKKWYCKVCIKPEIINTPYILTEDEVASISLECGACGEIYITEHKKIISQNGELWLCNRCSSSSSIN